MKALPVILLAAMAVVTSGCYARKPTAISNSKAVEILQRDGWHPRSSASGVDSDFAWQRPNDPPSAMLIGLTFTRHRIEHGEVISETYGWTLIPGIFFILPGFLVNLPIPLEDQTHQALTSPKG